MCVCVCTHWPAEHHSSSVDSDPALQFVRPHCVHQYPAEALWGEREGGEKVTEKRLKLGFCYLKSFLLLMLKPTRQAQKLWYVSFYLLCQPPPASGPALWATSAPGVLQDARPCEAAAQVERRVKNSRRDDTPSQEKTLFTWFFQ